MTFELLKKIVKENEIPEDATLFSDSGWECGSTEMNGVFYSAEVNAIIFTQIGEEILKRTGVTLKDDVSQEFPDAKMIYSYAMMQQGVDG